MAPDHPWVTEHPDFFVPGTEEQLAAQPQNYCRVGSGPGARILAYGRDPYFDGWPDTLQLNYGNPALQEAMLGELGRIARQCDGVRCDMAMLVLPEVFEKTWGIAAPPFWPRATEAVRAEVPGFLFLAEVYWDLEWTLQQQGFDYTYDKRLYDRLEEGHARPVREHLFAGLDFQDRLARFLENHDEPRAAATFAPEVHRAAAILTFLTPGLRFFHQGQREGKRVRIPVHLGRGPDEANDPAIAAFYDGLLECLKDPAFRDGDWQLLECRPGLGRERDAGRLRGLLLDRPTRRRAPPRRRQLRRSPEPVLRHAALARPRRADVAPPGPHRARRLRPPGRRPDLAGPLPRHARVGLPRLRRLARGVTLTC